MVFDAVMTEGSITRAAERLAMTQPAVSNAVSRMRMVWKDELFVKEGRRIQPTLFAQNLWTQVRTPLQALSEAVDPQDFDPATSTRTFRIAVASAGVDIAWKPLRAIIEAQAQNVNIHAIPYTIANGEKVLIDAEVDLVIGTMGNMMSPVIHSEFLFNPCYVCIMRPGHPLAKKDLTLEEFASAPHLLVSLSGDVTGYTDQVLAQHGLKRRIAMSVNHFSAVPGLIESSDLIAVVPPTALEESIFSGRVAVTEPPLPIPGSHIGSFWHKRQETDAGLCWLRSHLSQIMKQHAEKHFAELEKRFCGACAA
ncbi:LysR family transcriptional regulator [Alteromonas sediminis]|uniref:LysR family transcriptional regulator n=2 Tax=Alteromonas sediminis TaxID=2259342 RepID=A0A3N5ZBQ3_9ALTE|nr:LysR family transcriptional regulator [Alteromonas sediminis]